MAFFCADEAPAKWQFGSEIPALPGDPELLSEFKFVDLVPTSLNELVKWCFVHEDIHPLTDEKKYTLCLVDGEEESGHKEVVLRFQGVVEKATLNALGNWDKSLDGAHKATQSLRIYAGNHDALFNTQIDGINNIAYLILSALNKRDDYRPLQNNSSILFKQRVFSKNTHSEAKNTILKPEDDPAKTWKKIQDMWVCNGRAILGALVDSKLRPTHDYAIRASDLVDVTATVDITRQWKAGRNVVKIFLKPRRVVKLKEQVVKPSNAAVGANVSGYANKKAIIVDDDAFAIEM